MKTIQNSLAIVANAIGQQVGVKVYFRNGGAAMSFQKRAIYLPIGNEDDKEFMEMTYGYTAHECAHFRFSDPKVVESLKHSPLRFKFTNMIEDIRIESALGRIYPGLKNYLDRLNALMIAKGMFGHATPDLPPLQMLHTYILSVGYFVVSHLSEFKPLADISRQVLQTALTPSVEQALYQLMCNINTIESNSESLALADKCLALLDELADENRSDDSDSDSDDTDSDDAEQDQTADLSHGSSPQGEDSGDEPDNDSNTDNESPADPDMDQGSGLADELDDQVSAGSGSESTGTGDEYTDEQKEALAEFARGVLNGNPDDIAGDKTESVAWLLNDLAQTADYRGVATASAFFAEMAVVPRVDNQLHQCVSSEAAMVRFSLSSMLQSKKPVKRRRAKTGSRVDPRRIHRIDQGDHSIFVKQNKVKGINTAFYLLVDTSESMETCGTDRLPRAREASLALALALDGINNVSVEVAQYPLYEWLDDNPDNYVGRLGIIKPFESKAASVSAGFNFMGIHNTPTAEAVLGAASRLNNRKEERKIIFVMTDGLPDCPEKLIDAVNRCSQSGIECIGVGIQADASHFPTHIRVDNLSELSSALSSLASQKILAA